VNSTLLALVLAATPTTPPESPPAPAKLGLCVACHGADGRSRTPAAPHIGGQNEAYLVWALTQYREGRREGDVMSSVAGVLNGADIEALSAWYARQTWPAITPATPVGAD
jgi:cytochrome c553